MAAELSWESVLAWRMGRQQLASRAAVRAAAEGEAARLAAYLGARELDVSWA